MLAIGIDIGGTKILGAVVNQEGTILTSTEKPTSISLGKKEVLNSIYYVISDLVNQYPVDVIGVGSAGRVNVDKGEIYYSTPNLPDWTGLKIADLIKEKFNLPVIVDNDVNVAGIGEKWIGSGRDYQSLVLVTLGTGIAAAVYVNGELIRGNHWSTGEVGHMILYPHGKECNCGQRGCLEQYCSGTALYKNYNESSQTHLIKSGKEFFQLVDQGNPTALKVLDKFVDDLSIAIVSLCNVYDPEAFIIGGGLIDTKHFWWELLVEKIGKYSNAAVSNPTLLAASFKNNAGVIGAAKLGLDYFRNIVNK